NRHHDGAIPRGAGRLHPADDRYRLVRITRCAVAPTLMSVSRIIGITARGKIIRVAVADDEAIPYAAWRKCADNRLVNGSKHAPFSQFIGKVSDESGSCADN